MSINSCSINEYTVNTLCGRRRSAIISELQNQPVPVYVGHSQQKVSPDTKLPLQMFRRPDRAEEIDFDTLELPHIQVTIEMQGEKFSQTLERNDSLPLVTAFGLEMKNRMEERVNITDITIRII